MILLFLYSYHVFSFPDPFFMRALRYIRNLMRKNIVTIVGTTGVGKSQFSIDLAKAINGEIINADSMQVYKGLDQITNKHPMEERQDIPHHVMNHVDWTDEYFIHRYSEEANEAIESIFLRGKIPIIVGGTHYYLLSLLFDNKTISAPGAEPNAEQLQVLDGPVEGILHELQKVDPVIAGKFHPRDQRKLRRALEIYYTTGTLASQIYQEQKREEMIDSSLKYNTLLFWVYSDPQVLSSRLDKRVDKMIELGAMQEIEQLYLVYNKMTETPDCTRGIWQVIGFKEFLPWLADTTNKKLLDEGIERMKIRTRQYAKSQVKWIRKLLSIELQKEARFDYKNGGKMYLLDATNLDAWATNVGDRGLEIAKDFLAGGVANVQASQAPRELEHILPSNEYMDNFKSNKKIGSETNWKHFTCEHCKDKNGQPLVAVGEENWQLHIKSRKHKKHVDAIARKRRHEEMLAKYGKDKRQKNTETEGVKSDETEKS